MTRTLVLAPALLAICLSGGASAAPETFDSGLSVELVVEDLSNPTALAFIGPDDFLVIQKENGHVRRVTNGTFNGGTVADLSVNGGSDCERGLLGIAVHPDFAAAVDPKPWVYFYFTSNSAPGDTDDCSSTETNEVVRYTWDGDSLETPFPILSLPSDEGIHNGGPLAFGPDNTLYGVNGDNNRNGQLQNNAAGDPPDDTSIVFRVNDDGTLPADNPLDADLDGDDPEDKVFAYGVRNSFGLAFDPETGEPWDTENGALEFDEINHLVPGANSGWRDIMGPGAAPAGLFSLPGSTYVEPAYSIQDTNAVTGLAFASTNSALGAENVGKLFVADFNEGQIYRFTLNAMRDGLALADEVANNQNELDGFAIAGGFEGGITDLEEGPDGNLYVVAHGGAVYRIVSDAGPAVHDLAVASVKAPKKVTLSESKPTVTGGVAVTIVNQGSHAETIPNLQTLEDLVTLDVTALTVGCPDAPVMTLAPLKQAPPLQLAPRKKLKLVFQLAFDCATEATAEFEYEVTVDHSLLGDPDDDPGDDVCPRAASADDKGCGGKPAGSPIRTDVGQK